MNNRNHEKTEDIVSEKHQFREVAKMIPYEEVTVV